MLSLGLSAREQRDFHQLLRRSHQVKTTIQVMDLDRKRLADVSRWLIDGSVNVVNDADTTRGASLSLVDTSRHIGFGSGDPSDGAMYLNNALHIVNSYRLDNGDWVDVPVFDGPIASISRDQDTLAIEAQGWESRARKPIWHEDSWRYVTPVTQVIKQLMRAAGETRFDIPNLDVLTPEEVSLGRMGQPWHHAQQLAKSIDRQLFYDARGILRLRKRPQKPCWVFRTGDRGTITQAPQVDFDLAEMINTVWVKGHNPKGSKPRVDGWAQLPWGNKASPHALRRNDVPLHLVEVVENKHLKTNRACYEHAVKLVNEHGKENLNVSFDAMPVPHLEPGDIVHLDSGSWQQSFRIKQFTIPLSPDGQGASFGYIRELVPGRKAHKRPVHAMVVPIHRGHAGRG